METDHADDEEHHRVQDVRVTIPHPPAARWSSTIRSPAVAVAVAGMHTPVSLVSTYPDVNNAPEMVDEENVDEEEDMDYDGQHEDCDDGYAEGDCVEGSIEPDMVDEFLDGEQGRKFRSKVWNEFVKIRVAGVVVKGQCKHCEAQITAKRGVGTTAMRRHLRRCKVRQKVVNVVKQLNATVMSPEGVALKDWRFNQEASRRELLRMIVLHELPLSIVEYEGFRRFVSSLNPVFKMVSRRTITIDCLASFHEHKQVLQEAFKNYKSRVSLTMDMWTSNQTLGYMCITCHCIDDAWNMQKRILKFSFVKTPHTGIALFSVVLNSIQDWNIEDKIFSITLDNASNNNAMVQLLKANLLEKQMLVGNGKLLHQRCAAHVLNLICQAGLQSMNAIFHKIRESVKYIQGSPSRKQKFEEIVQQLGMSCQQRPNIDVSTRWNSTYLMVECAMEFKRAFDSLQLQDSEYTCAPTEEEWGKAKIMVALLKHFFDATNVISGTLYPTANLHFHEVWEVKMALDNIISELDVDLVETIEYMVRKFHKYWKLTWLQISIPVLFDPRFKMPFIEFRFNKAFGTEAPSKIAAVKRVFMGLFQDYSQKNIGNQEAMQAAVQDEVATHASGRYADWDNYMSMNADTTNAVPTEVETYLAKPPIPRGGNFDILSWWKSNSLEFPVLSRIARDVLVVPASSVASESAFSTGGRVLSDFRSRLKPDTVEALICLQD